MEANYEADRIDEHSNIHFDYLLLREFASVNKDKGLCVTLAAYQGNRLPLCNLYYTN